MVLAQRPDSDTRRSWSTEPVVSAAPGRRKPDFEEVSAALHLQHGVLRLPILLNPKQFPEPQVAYSSHSGITNPRSPTHGGAFDDDPSGHEDISG
jgi:hypothetical protein